MHSPPNPFYCLFSHKQSHSQRTIEKLNKNSNTWYKSDFGCLHFSVWKTKEKNKLWFMIFIPIFSDFVSEFSLVDFSDAAMFIPISTIKIIKEKKNKKIRRYWWNELWDDDISKMMIFIVFIENLFFCCLEPMSFFTFSWIYITFCTTFH